jgi:hypothetical protein
MNRTGATVTFSGKRLPLAAGSQNENDTFKYKTGIFGLAPTTTLSGVGLIRHSLTYRNQWLDTTPKFISDFPCFRFCHLLSGRPATLATSSASFSTGKPRLSHEADCLAKIPPVVAWGITMRGKSGGEFVAFERLCAGQPFGVGTAAHHGHVAPGDRCFPLGLQASISHQPRQHSPPPDCALPAAEQYRLLQWRMKAADNGPPCAGLFQRPVHGGADGCTRTLAGGEECRQRLVEELPPPSRVCASKLQIGCPDNGIVQALSRRGFFCWCGSLSKPPDNETGGRFGARRK